MLTRHVALVSEDSSITLGELSAVAAANQKQVSRDFGPLWSIDATVTAFERLEDVPLDYWPIIIKDDIGDPSAAGYHEDQQGQPFALVQYATGWELTVSHENLEMLADPFGRRMIAGKSPVKGQGRVKFLVEVCDPSEAEEFAYTVNGITVSDFYTPRFFDPVTAPGVRYSFSGAITAPRQVLRGGYLSWYDPSSRKWWQRTYFGSKPVDKSLGMIHAVNGNLREAIDRVTKTPRMVTAAKAMEKTDVSKLRKPGTLVELRPFESRAKDLRLAIHEVTQARK